MAARPSTKRAAITAVALGVKKTESISSETNIPQKNKITAKKMKLFDPALVLL